MSGDAHRVLLVDDDADNREVLGELLELAGFQVLSARSAQQAIDQLHQHDVQLVLTDYQLTPGGNPLSELQRLRAAAAPAPLGIVTGWRLDAGDMQRVGASFVVEKPYSGDELLGLVGSRLNGLTVAPESQELVRRYFQALSRRDWDGFVSLCTEDVVYHLPGADKQFSTTVIGRSALRGFTEKTFQSYPEARFVVTSIVGVPNGAVGRYEVTWSGLGKPLTGAVVFQFRDGLIKEIGVRVRVKELAAASSPPPG